MNEEMLMALISGDTVQLEKTAMERLTKDRLASGSLGQDVEDMLSESGIYWDTLNKEYFNIEVFQHETFERLAAEYVSQDYA
jgi:hypothetical protein